MDGGSNKTLDLSRIGRWIARAKRVGKFNCWYWPGAIESSGYGAVWKDGRTQRAHRVIYEHMVGKIPQGMLLRHKCNIPRCVNPDHLTPGTSYENSQDALMQGRLRTAPPLEPRVIELILAHPGTRLQAARDLGVSLNTIWRTHKRAREQAAA